MACAQAYGRTTYLATTLRRVPRGTEGAVSAEGTAAGLAAAVAFAALATALGQVGLLCVQNGYFILTQRVKGHLHACPPAEPVTLLVPH